MLRSLVAEQTTSDSENQNIWRNLPLERLETALTEGHWMWMDVTDPVEDELRWLETVLKLHPAVIEDLHRQDRRPALMVYPDYVFLSLFQPCIHLNRVESEEIHCLIGERFFVTVRTANSRAVDGTYERVAQSPASLQRGAAYSMYLVAQFVVDSYYPLLDKISLTLNELEEQVLKGDNHSPERTTYLIKQQVITLREMLAPQRELLSNLIGEERFNRTPENRDLFRHLYERTLRVYDVIDSQRELSNNVLDLVESQESTRLTHAVNRLTVFSMIFLPLTFLISVFELNFVTTNSSLVIPMSGWHAFVLIVVLMTVSAGGMVLFFRYKGWL